MKMGQGNSTLIGRGEKGTLLSAALYNGMIAHAEELDDSHRYVSGLHLSAVVIPAALAVAEERGLSGKEFITAVVCGYEAAARICRCIEQGHRTRGFHSTGTVGPFGACAAAGTALGLDAEQMVQAIGIAGSMGAGLFAFLDDGATVKHLHTGRASLDGLLAALMAQAGLTGPRAVLEAREGFFRAYADSSDETPLLQPVRRIVSRSECVPQAALRLRPRLSGHRRRAAPAGRAPGSGQGDRVHRRSYLPGRLPARKPPPRSPVSRRGFPFRS